MTKVRAGLLFTLVALVACVAATSAAAGTTECKSIKNCIDVVGPWVVVKPQSGSTFLLACPKKKGGTIGGLDAQATSTDVRVTFDGLLGGPIGAGTTTGNAAYFRALSVRGKVGAFQPRIGCIPSSSGGRQTTSARVVSPGPALTLAATAVKLTPGTVRTAHIACPRPTRFVSSWDATAFQTAQPPSNLAIAGAIRVQRSDGAGSSSLTVTTSETLPPGLHAQVQLGVICAG